MDYTEKDFGKILKGNALKMRRLMLKSGTTCMRVYDRNLERFFVTVDLYGPYARITDFSEEGLDDETERVCCDIVSRMLYVQADHVVFHRRPKRVGKEQHELQSDESLQVQVTENDLLFTVDLTKRIDTGLFLDHMLTRQMVREMSDGLSVLNLFSYTGAFSVYAAKGGAKRVESVDLSSTYTAWAQQNLLDNGFPKELFPCIAGDAWQYVVEAVKEGRKYDLIVFDPPCFSNSRKMEHDFDVQRDYLRYLKVLNALLTRDGILLFSTNLNSFRFDKGAIRGYEVEEISSSVAAHGFTHRLGIARSWLLYKQQEVRLYAGDLQTVDKKAARMQHDYENMEKETMAKKKEIKEEMIEDVKKDAVVAEETVQAETFIEETVESKVEADTTEEIEVSATEEIEEDTDFVEDEDENEISDEDDDEVEFADEEAPVAEANSIEDDVLTLQWEDDDIAPLASDSDEEVNADDADASVEPRRAPREYSQGRDDRRPSGDRERRPSYGDRRPSGDRDSRPSFGGDRERRPYGDRDSRPSFGGDRERRPYGDRDSRPSFGGDRDSRPSYGDRRPSGDRPSYGDRRPSGDRDSRPSYGDRGGRPSFGGDRRPSFGGDRRPVEGAERRDRKSSPKPYGFDKFKETRTRGQEENNDSFFWLEDHKDDK